MSELLFAATLAAALDCGLMAGAFFAFSTLVMDGLSRLPSDQGIAAMQSINKAAITPAFMTALFGTAVACVALIAAAVVTLDERHAPWLLAGAALYLVGTVVLTIAYHVPRNDALATVDPHGADAAERWTRYVSEWTAGNHVRGAAALAAAGLLTVALSVA